MGLKTRRPSHSANFENEKGLAQVDLARMDLAQVDLARMDLAQVDLAP